MDHHRRKSGHGLGNTSMTDVRKAATSSESSSKSKRPSTTRRHTPSGSSKSSRSHRERDRERDQYDDWQQEPESFPQFWYASQMSTYSAGGGHSYYSTGSKDRGDIIPRATPSRAPLPHYSRSPPPTQSNVQYSSTLSAFGSLSIAPQSSASPYDTGYQYSSEGYTYDAGSSAAEQPLPTRPAGTYSRSKKH
ncbi:hypothetical protein E4U41_000759 [Claviceps citrina]|nr:hypothetical protein E4U41_000759 [Claviceps citrina]